MCNAPLTPSRCLKRSMDSIDAGIQFLAEAGLNLFACLDCAALPEPLQKQMMDAGVPLLDYGRLVLTGHGGKQLWAQLQKADRHKSDPVDHYSINVTNQFIADFLDGADHLLLYPSHQYLIPLQQLGELAGWGRPSPLGQSIHPEFGVWFAHRTAFLTKSALPVMKGESGLRPCDTCTAKPCLTACPVGAVTFDHFNITNCVDFRLQPNSICADRCLARMACPAAPQHRYPIEQIQYHYTQSLDMIRLYAGDEKLEK